jgi:DNA helicase HerA-like ATPase
MDLVPKNPQSRITMIDRLLGELGNLISQGRDQRSNCYPDDDRIRQALKKHQYRCGGLANGTGCSTKYEATNLYVQEIDGDYVPLCDECLEKDPLMEAPEPKPGERGYIFQTDGDGYRYETRKRDGKRVCVGEKGRDGSMYAGRYARALIEEVDEDLPCGYFKNVDINPVYLDSDSLNRHTAIFGNTGVGKTTFFSNLISGFVRGNENRGLCLVDLDPDGELAWSVLKKLPEKRLKDVVVIDPADTEKDRVVSLNPLDAGEDILSGNAEDDSVEGRIGVIETILPDIEDLKASRRVLRTYVRGAIRDQARNYSLADIAWILGDRDRRERFAERLRSQQGLEFVQHSAEGSVDLEEEVRDALMRRLETLTQSRQLREIACSRESSVDMTELVKEGRIVILRNSSTNKEVKEIVTMTLASQLWDSVRRMEYDDNDPVYGLMMDEVRKVRDAVGSGFLDEILDTARSSGLATFLSMQSPSQFGEDVKGRILADGNNLISFRIGGNGLADVAEELSISEDDLLEIDDYKAWIKRGHIERGGDEDKGARLMNSFPEYPNLRTDEEVEDIIQDSLEKHGRKRRSAEEMYAEITGDKASEKARLEREMIRAIDDLTLTDGSVPVKEADRHLRTRSKYTAVDEETVQETDLARLRESSKNIEVTQNNGEPNVRLTESGKEMAAEERDTGLFGGGDAHRRLVESLVTALSRKGCYVRAPKQDRNEKPDAVVHVPEDADPVAHYLAGADIQRTADTEDEAFESKERVLYAEIESNNKPEQTLKNLRQATEDDTTCGYVVAPGPDDPTESAKKVANVLRKARDGYLYNSNEYLELNDGSVPLVPKGSTAKWEKDGEYILGVAGERTRTDDPGSLAPDEYPYPVARKKDGMYVVVEDSDTEVYSDLNGVKEDWTLLRKPLIVNDLSKDTYEIVVLDNAEIRLYEEDGGELVEPDDVRDMERTRQAIRENAGRDGSDGDNDEDNANPAKDNPLF